MRPALGRTLSRTAVAVAGLSMLVAGCDGNGDADLAAEPSAVRIGAFNFSESEMLAEIYAQALEARGIPVERLGRVGSREVVQPALELGLIDIVPEYAGTMLSFVSLGANDPAADSAATIAELRAVLEPRGMVALEPADAQNRNAVIVIRSFAAEHGLRDVSDLVGIADELTFGGPVECPERPFCLLGLRDLYGLEFATFAPIPTSAVVADSLRVGEIDVGLLFSTDPALVDTDFVVLSDDLGLQPAENIVPIVRADALQRWGPDVGEALDQVSARLDTADLALLNLQTEDDQADVAEVAALWLTE